MVRTIKAVMVLAVVTAAVVAVDERVAGGPPPKQIALTPLGQYRTGVFDGAAAEIAAYDSWTRRVFTVNVAQRRIDVIDILDPAHPVLATTIDVSPYGAHANSVAVKDGVVVAAVEANVKTDPGKAVFFTPFGEFISAVTVGSLPDMVTFTPNGDFVLVANEGEPNGAYTIDPEGSVSIIDVGAGAAAITDADVTQAGFAAFNAGPLDPSIRIFGPGATVAKDLEPEYIAVSHDSHTAWVTLQENNAIAVLDLKSKSFTKLVGLGFKNHNLAGNGLDPSDTDGANSIQPWPVWGMFQPDAIASFQHQGRTYLVTANEGDVREYAGFPGGIESVRVSSGSVVLDPTAFPNSSAIKSSPLGRLNITKFSGDTDRDGDFDALFAFGARSFSIWSEGLDRVFDSGDALEQITRTAYPLTFNASNTNNTRDNRSDDKGPEPEGITVAKLFGRTYAFVTLERIGGIVVYEIVNPAAPLFVQYINTRDFSVAPSSASAGELAPEGILVIQAEDAPAGRPLLVTANEVSGTVRVFEIGQVK